MTTICQERIPTISFFTTTDCKTQSPWQPKGTKNLYFILLLIEINYYLVTINSIYKSLNMEIHRQSNIHILILLIHYRNYLRFACVLGRTYGCSYTGGEKFGWYHSWQPPRPFLDGIIFTLD